MERNNDSYKSEQKVSIELAKAFDNKTVKHTLVNTAFFQSELGMRAGSRRRSRRLSHLTKPGIRAALISKREIFAG